MFKEYLSAFIPDVPECDRGMATRATCAVCCAATCICTNILLAPYMSATLLPGNIFSWFDSPLDSAASMAFMAEAMGVGAVGAGACGAATYGLTHVKGCFTDENPWSRGTKALLASAAGCMSFTALGGAIFGIKALGGCGGLIGTAAAAASGAKFAVATSAAACGPAGIAGALGAGSVMLFAKKCLAEPTAALTNEEEASLLANTGSNRSYDGREGQQAPAQPRMGV